MRSEGREPSQDRWRHKGREQPRSGIQEATSHVLKQKTAQDTRVSGEGGSATQPLGPRVRRVFSHWQSHM